MGDVGMGVEGDKGGGGEGGDLSLKDVMQEIKSLSLDVRSKFVTVEACMHEFRAELISLRAEMVSRRMFDQLESRVSELEMRGLSCPEVDFLRQQVDKFDPANRSIRLRGLKQKSLNERKGSIDEILKDLGIPAIHQDHIFKGPKDKREITDVAVIEFPSRNVREEVLKEFNKKSRGDSTIGILNADRAETQLQLKRNYALREALKNLKADSRSKNKDIQIVWKKTDSKEKIREVIMNGTPVFSQAINVMVGNFLPPFRDLVITM